MNQNNFDLDIYRRYQILQKIGEGYYAVVWKIRNKHKKKFFALKKIIDAFQNLTDARRTYRQISILTQIQHNNIIKLQEIIINKKQLFLIFEYMHSDLSAVIKKCNFYPIQKKYILWQIIKALNYLHKRDIIHRDIKPSNILINQNCHVKICDFGLSRILLQQIVKKQSNMTQYVASRFYRPPEVILGQHKYGFSIDMWAFGCIMAEMITKKPLFKGFSIYNHLQKIFQLIGMPNKDQINEIKNQSGKNFLNKFHQVHRKPIQDVVSMSQQQLDLFISCLQFDPKKRINSQQALLHPYFREFRDIYQQHIDTFTMRIIKKEHIKDNIQEYRNQIEQISKKLRKEHFSNPINQQKIQNSVNKWNSMKSAQIIENDKDSYAKSTTSKRKGQVDFKKKKKNFTMFQKTTKNSFHDIKSKTKSKKYESRSKSKPEINKNEIYISRKRSKIIETSTTQLNKKSLKNSKVLKKKYKKYLK